MRWNLSVTWEDLYLICNDGGCFSWLATGDNLLGDSLPECPQMKCPEARDMGEAGLTRDLSGRSESLHSFSHCHLRIPSLGIPWWSSD